MGKFGADRETQGNIVLLVEDDPSVLAVLQQTLTDAGLAVVPASGQEAAEHLLADTMRGVAVVVADLALSDGDGGALLDAAALHGLPAIAITGHPERVPQGRPAGPVVVLAKPFQPERLVAEVRRCLSGG